MKIHSWSIKTIIDLEKYKKDEQSGNYAYTFSEYNLVVLSVHRSNYSIKPDGKRLIKEIALLVPKTQKHLHIATSEKTGVVAVPCNQENPKSTLPKPDWKINQFYKHSLTEQTAP